MAADADPNTGAAVYDSIPYSGSSGWWQVGGTSLSAPIIASVYALNGGLSPNTIGTSVPYLYFTSLNSHDVKAGSNGICGNSMCQGVVGYDGPTGLGTPNGTTGFGTAPSNAPSPIAPPTDTTKPTVMITSPANHATVPRRANITVSASASDNIGVTKVVFYRNGTAVCTVTTGVYACTMFTAQNRASNGTCSIPASGGLYCALEAITPRAGLDPAVHRIKGFTRRIAGSSPATTIKNSVQ